MTRAILALDQDSTGEYGDVTLVVPTLNEAPNLEAFLRHAEASAPGCHVLIADDDSQDETRSLAARFHGRVHVHVLHRRIPSDCGLTASVADGILRASTPYLVVMDADLQHPADTLPRILAELRAGRDLVIASRSDDSSFTLRRRILSRNARRLARMHLRRRSGVDVRDPMSGFFGVRTALAQAIVREHGHEFERGGFKVLMDLLLHAPRGVDVAETPYVFQARHAGESKLTRRHYVSFLRQLGPAGRMLASLADLVLSGILLRFALVGLSGVLVNELALFGLHEGALLPLLVSSAIAVELSILWNFAWNESWTFRGRGTGSLASRVGMFHAASALGMVVNVAVLLAGTRLLPDLSYLVVNLVGIAAGSALNFLLNLRWTWGVRVEEDSEPA